MEEKFENGLDEDRKVRRKRRVNEMRRRKRRQALLRKWLRVALPVAAGVLILAVVLTGRSCGKTSGAEMDGNILQKEGEEKGKEALEMGNIAGGDSVNIESGDGETVFANEEEKEGGRAEKEAQKDAYYSAEETEDTLQLGDGVVSSYAVLIDVEGCGIIAEKNAYTRMNPASMTKVLTLLVAAERIDNLEDTFTITQEITDYSFVNGCSNAGFEKNETVTVKDLLYGTILPSGAEAAVGLATYAAGSQEAFVELMNEKLEELGLAKSAHFTNCVGVYDENHYCTVYDMAVIMKAATDDELCREVLSSRTYTTSETEEHPEGMLLSNWFLRRIEDKEVGGKVAGAKTGYVKESGSCAASYGLDKEGKAYICVTADADNQWRCINDHAELYRKVMMKEQP